MCSLDAPQTSKDASWKLVTLTQSGDDVEQTLIARSAELVVLEEAEEAASVFDGYYDNVFLLGQSGSIQARVNGTSTSSV